MLPERDSRCNYHEVCDDPVCDGVGHCKDAALIVEVQKPSTNSQSVAALFKWRDSHIDRLSTPAWCEFNAIVERLNSGVPEQHT